MGIQLSNIRLVGGLDHFLYSIICGIILSIDFHIFQDGYCTTHQTIKYKELWPLRGYDWFILAGGFSVNLYNHQRLRFNSKQRRFNYETWGIYNDLHLSGWWFQPTPLKNIWVRQLEWWHSIPNWMKVIKFHGSKPPTSYIYNLIHTSGWLSEPPPRQNLLEILLHISLFGKVFPNYWNQPGWHAILFVSFM